MPYIARVTNMRAAEDGLEVALEPSQARHVLQRGSPDFAEFEARLREAMRSNGPLILTDDDTHNIIDVRAFMPGPDGPLPPFPKPERLKLPWPIRLWRWPWWPWWCWWYCWGCISATRAQQVFDAMSATSCAPLTVPAPCIPFLYPDDGCWARAHEMCRLMILMGLAPEKVWIQGGLYVSTRNDPNCHVRWGWHVATTLCVRGPRFLQTQAMVIDPALFQTPV